MFDFINSVTGAAKHKGVVELIKLHVIISSSIPAAGQLSSVCTMARSVVVCFNLLLVSVD